MMINDVTLTLNILYIIWCLSVVGLLFSISETLDNQKKNIYCISVLSVIVFVMSCYAV